MELKGKGCIGNLGCVRKLDDKLSTNVQLVIDTTLTEEELKKLEQLFDCSSLQITVEIKEPILTGEEQRYLNDVIRPFRNRIDSITKNTNVTSYEYITIEMDDDDIATLPYFKENTMYKNMEPNKEYSLEELNL